MKKILFVLVALGVTGLTLWNVQRQQGRMMEAIEEAESGRPTFREDEVEEDMETAEEHFALAEQALAEGDLPASYKAYQRAHGAVSVWVDHYASNPVPKGDTTLVRWYRALEDPYLAAVSEAFPTELEAMAVGDRNPIDVRDLARYYEQLGYPKLLETFEASEPEIADRRARAATRWLMVYVSSVTPGYTEVIRAAIEQGWSDRYGIKLVYGSTLSNEERRALWKHLQVTVDIHNAIYQDKNRAGNRTLYPNIPERAEVTFKLEGSDNFPTSWDEVEPFTARVDVPDSIWVEVGDKGADEVRRVEEEKTEEMIAALSKSLEALPPFEIFPGVDLTQVQLVKNGRLDRDAFMAVSLVDRARGVKELATLAHRNDPALNADVCYLAVVLEMEEAADFVTWQLGKLDRKVQREVVSELAKRPHYGQFKPLLSLIENTPAGQQPPGEALQALGRHFEDQTVKQAFLDKLSDRQNPNRTAFLYPFVPNASEEDLRQLVPVWVADPDPEFASQAYNMVRNRSQSLVDGLMEKHFHEANPRLQEVMLMGIRYNPEQHSEALLQIIQQTAARRDNPDLQRRALNLLLEAAYVPAVWDFLNAFSEDGAQDKEVAQIRSRLVYNVRRAHPDRAEALLWELLEKGDSEIRFSAAMALLDQNEDKLENLQLLAQRIQTRDEPGTLRGTVQAAFQYAKIRKGWDYIALHGPLLAVLDAARQSGESHVREKAYTVMSRGAEAGDSRYADLLRASATSETEDALKKQIAQLLANQP